MKWSEIKPGLEDGSTGQNWWSLTEATRREIATSAIQNTIFYGITYYRSGGSNCTGGEGEWGRAQCQINALLRVIRFGNGSIGDDSCYWKRGSTGNEYCYVPEKPYHLPCHLISTTISGGGWGHALAGIQVVNATNTLSNWIVFQYSNYNIKPGHIQMPKTSGGKDVYATIRAVNGMSGCQDYTSHQIAKFNLNEAPVERVSQNGILHITTAPTGGEVSINGTSIGVATTYQHAIPIGETRDKISVKVTRKHFKDKLFNKTLRSGLHEYALYRLVPANKLKGTSKKSSASGSVTFTFAVHRRSGGQVGGAAVKLLLLNSLNGQLKSLSTNSSGAVAITIPYSDSFFESGKQKLVCIVANTADRIRTFRTITIKK